MYDIREDLLQETTEDLKNLNYCNCLYYDIFVENMKINALFDTGSDIILIHRKGISASAMPRAGAITPRLRGVLYSPKRGVRPSITSSSISK